MAHKLFLLMTLLLCICQNSFSIFAQENQSIFPLFDLYGSASYSSGLRLGPRMQISEHFSFETGFGIDVANFLVPSDVNYRYSIGINWHKSFESKLVVNLTYVQLLRPPKWTTNGYAISLNIGSLSLIDGGFHFFYSGGIWLKRLRNIDYTYFLPNLEIGVGWSFN